MEAKLDALTMHSLAASRYFVDFVLQIPGQLAQQWNSTRVQKSGDGNEQFFAIINVIRFRNDCFD